MSATYSVENFRLKHALGYTDLGWSIFPLHWPKFNASGEPKCSCGKECSNLGKHPRTADGFKSATIDESVICKWWMDWPSANTGYHHNQGKDHHKK